MRLFVRGTTSGLLPMWTAWREGFRLATERAAVEVLIAAELVEALEAGGSRYRVRSAGYNLAAHLASPPTA